MYIFLLFLKNICRGNWCWCLCRHGTCAPSGIILDTSDLFLFFFYTIHVFCSIVLSPDFRPELDLKTTQKYNLNTHIQLLFRRTMAIISLSHTHIVCLRIYTTTHIYIHVVTHAKNISPFDFHQRIFFSSGIFLSIFPAESTFFSSVVILLCINMCARVYIVHVCAPLAQSLYPGHGLINYVHISSCASCIVNLCNVLGPPSCFREYHFLCAVMVLLERTTSSNFFRPLKSSFFPV